jgi:hypothetical protein
MLDNYLLRPAVLEDVWVEMNPITGKVTLHVEYTNHNFNSHIDRDGINLFLEVARMLKSYIGETIVAFKGQDDVGFYVLFKESDQKVIMFNREKKDLLCT